MPHDTTPRSSPTPHRALCLSCSRIAIRETITRSDSILEATFQCERGHVMTCRWLAAA